MKMHSHHCQTIGSFVRSIQYTRTWTHTNIHILNTVRCLFSELPKPSITHIPISEEYNDRWHRRLLGNRRRKGRNYRVLVKLYHSIGFNRMQVQGALDI